MALKAPTFIDIDLDTITTGMIAQYEQEAGKTLYPAQAERLLLNVWAYRERLLRVAIQEAAQQNLVAFAREPMLDYLGELVGVLRLPAQAATTQLQFQLGEEQDTDLFIPAGTRISASDSVIFITDADALIKVGMRLVNVSATCTEAGTAGNGWQPAQISTLLDELGDVDLQVSNLTPSTAGSAQEEDDRLRERIKLAPESFTNAGSRMAYRFHAMQGHPNIVDVAVLSPVPGTVELYPLLSTGLPDESLLRLVERLCTDEKVRPLTDTVCAKSPIQLDYHIDARLTLYQGQEANAVEAQAQQAIQQWVASRAPVLGKDIVPSQLIAALSVAGVYQVELISPSFISVPEKAWANCTHIKLTLAGIADD